RATRAGTVTLRIGIDAQYAPRGRTRPSTRGPAPIEVRGQLLPYVGGGLAPIAAAQGRLRRLVGRQVDRGLLQGGKRPPRPRQRTHARGQALQLLQDGASPHLVLLGDAAHVL